MPRSIAIIAPVALAAGGWWFFQHYSIEGLENVTIRPRAAVLAGGDAVGAPEPVAAHPGATVRVASFNIQVFGTTKLAKPAVMDALVRIVRQFDVVAVQEVRATDQNVVPQFVAMINADGSQYDFVLGQRLGRTSSKEQYAFIYNRASIDVVPGSVYTVDDPDDLLHREPLVAGFRVRGPPQGQELTFTLINIHTDPDEVADELNALDDVYRAVQSDGRFEDDVLLLGDLNTNDSRLYELGQVAYLQAAIKGVPSNTRGTQLYDNILFDRRATTEFTGRSGVFDMMNELGLTMNQALEVSDHQPVWAEFSAYEGGRAGPLASNPAETPR